MPVSDTLTTLTAIACNTTVLPTQKTTHTDEEGGTCSMHGKVGYSHGIPIGKN